MEALIVLVSSLAAARVWRLLAKDDIGIHARNLHQRLVSKVGRFERLAKSLDEMYYCPWCLGFWICAAFVATGIALGGPVWWIVAGAFAANYISANLNVHLGDK